MSLYESVFIISQDVLAQDVNHIAEGVVRIVQNKGGALVKKEFWGIRTLAHEVKKNKRGYYVILYIDAPSDVVPLLDREYKLNEKIINYLTLKVDSIDPRPSTMMAAPDGSEE